MELGAVFLLLVGGLALIVPSVLTTLAKMRGKETSPPTVRPILAFQDMPVETGNAAERGGAVHIALGNGSLYGEDMTLSLAGLQVLESLVDGAVAYRASPIVTVGDPTLLPLAQDVLRRAYERSNVAELFDPRMVRFVASSPVAYAAGAGHLVSAEQITANMMVGSFGAEVSLIADAGLRRALPQLAAAAAPGAIGALYPATDHLAMGEELYAAGAQITEEPRYLHGLTAQDILRMVVIVAIAGSAVMALLGG
ncbi:MAG TPA: hypothetical protein ENN99_08880 [Chloroflexi bacterium]|nr:hypothetical protein [Chloroflexota bacterium]